MFRTVLLSLVFLFPAMAEAQSWDYEPYPYMPVDIHHLDAEIRITETGEIEGDLLYRMAFLDSGIDSLVFDAPGAEIERVVVNGTNRNHQKDSGRLIIYLDEETFDREDETTLQIRYRAAPLFGLHQTARGDFFTSFLPKTTSHWLPVIDHPRVDFTTELVIIHPSGKNVFANGRVGESGVVSVDEEMTTYVSNRPITPGGLFFVLGSFERAASTIDAGFFDSVDEDVARHFQRRADPQIHLYAASGSEDAAEILTAAASAYHKLAGHTGMPFPFRDLQLILLEDDYWETRNHGSGVIYLFRNGYDIEEQIRIGLIGQWFGMVKREVTWSEGDAVNILGASVYNQLFDGEYATGETPDPYNVFDAGMFSRWRYYLTEHASAEYRRNLTRAAERFLSGSPKVLDWNMLANEIYNNSGQGFFDRVTPGPVEIEEKKVYDYLVRMEWDEEENQLEIRFEAQGDYVEELVNVTVHENTLTGDRTHELTFTGRTDTIVLNVSTGVENVRLQVDRRDDIRLREEKPFGFWVYQLQYDSDPDNRIAAAAGLAEYSDNPDLQLALRDIMRDVEHPGVYAEILRSLAVVTKGASGTDQIFIERTSGNYPDKVRIAATEALAYYQGNDQVISRLRNIINQTENADIRTAAIRSLYEVTEPLAFKNIVESIITREAVLNQVPLILKLLVQHGEREAAVRFADTFLAEGFPYRIRTEVLGLVLEHDLSEQGWENRLPALLVDRDPRIRYQSVQGLANLGSQRRTEITENRIAEEFDERVRRALQLEL
jgi:HEAT repeat protein